MVIIRDFTYQHKTTRRATQIYMRWIKIHLTKKRQDYVYVTEEYQSSLRKM